MTSDIRELTEIEDLRQVGELWARIWGRAAEPALGPDVLKALSHSGNYVAGAYVDGQLVGGLLGWFGGDPRHDLHMHSHILGVLPGSETRGVGFELKEHQRRWCLERGVKVMEWTTDPLVRRNVYFNLAKLGARAPVYLVDFYGEMKDGINAGDHSDRLLIRWDLEEPKRGELDAEKLREWGSGALLSVGPAGEPVRGASSARVLVCQVPDDIVAMRRSQPALARQWRMALRDALGGAMERGYAVKGATRTGWYVLESGST